MLRDFKYNKKKYLLVVFSFLLLAFIVLFKQGLFENKALKSASYWEKQGRTRIADSSKIVSPVKKVAEGTPLDTITRYEEGKLPGGNSGKMYFIILGSFTNSENANITAKQYRSQGYETSIISTTNRYGKKTDLVSVKTISDFDEAVRYLREFQNKVDPKAWMYPNSETKLR